METLDTLYCHHAYIWSDCEHTDRTWRKIPQSLLYIKHRSESVYPHNFRLVAFGKRSYVERRRNYITSGYVAIKDFHDNLIGLISFHLVLSHCLARVIALAIRCSSSSNILTSSLIMFLLPFGPTCCSCYPTQLDWFEWRLWSFKFVGCIPPTGWPQRPTTFIANFISGYANRMISSTGSFIIMWRRTFQILNSSTSEDIGGCRFSE